MPFPKAYCIMPWAIYAEVFWSILKAGRQELFSKILDISFKTVDNLYSTG